MADFANLVLGVDTSGLKRGERALSDTTRAGGRTERAVKGTAQGFDRAGRSAAMATPKVAGFGSATNVTRGMAIAATRALTGMVIGLGAIIATSAGLSKFVSATVTADASQAQLGAAILSTGGSANRTIDQLNQHAAALQDVTNFGDETTNAMQGLLLTFTQIQGGTFDRATVAVLDVATAMGTDLNAAALQVGKALNDPVLGMTALSRSGIQFTESQKDAVKAMVATNDILGAQNLILNELERQFGGSAIAARDTLGGALTSLGNAWGDLFEISSEGSAALKAAVESLIVTISDPKFIASIQAIGVAMFGMAEVAMKALSGLVGVFDLLADNADILVISIGVLAVTKLPALAAMAISTTGWLIGMTGAMTAASVAAGVLAVTMNLIPFVAVVTGVTLLYRAYRDLGDTTGVTAAVTDTLSGSVDALNVALDTYSSSRSEPARQAAIDSAKAMEADAAATLANVSAKLAFLQVQADSNALFAETANQPGGLIYDLKLQVAEAERQLENARRTMQGLVRDAAEVNDEAGDLPPIIRAATIEASGLAGQMGAAARNALSFVQNLGNANISGLRAEVASLRGGGSDRDAFEASIRGSDAFQLALTGPVGLAETAIAGLNEELDAFDLRAERAALNADRLGSSVGGVGGAASATADALQDQISALEDAADPVRVYTRELAKLDELKLLGLSDGAYAAAVEELRDQLKDATPEVGKFTSMFKDGMGDAIDYMVDGFKDGFRGLLDILKSTIMQAIKFAIANPIKIALGIGGGAAGAAAGGGGGLLSGAMSSLIGGFGESAAIGGGIGATLGSLAGGTGLLGGAGSVLAGLGTGGLSGGVAAIGSAISGVGAAATAGTGMIGALGAAAGAIALPLLAVLAVVSFFKTKTKLIDQGIRATIDMESAMFESFKEIEKSRFWGLSKKRSTSYTAISGEDAAPFETAVFGIQESVIGAMDSLGLSIDALDGFTHEFKVSLKGLDDAAKEAAVLDALQGLGDAMADNILGLSDFALAGEASYATLTRLSASLATVNDAFRDLGFAAFNVSLAGADAAAQFAGLFGSLDNFTASTAAYYDQFYTNDEKLANATARLGENLAALGVDFIPATNKAFRDLVDTAMIGGDSDLAANLIMLAPAFDAVTDAANTLSDALMAAVNEDAFATGVDFRRGLSRASNGIEYTPQQSQAELMAELRSQNALMQSTLEIIANSSTQTAENTDYSNALTLDALV